MASTICVIWCARVIAFAHEAAEQSDHVETHDGQAPAKDPVLR
jgi:hypothetical protein